MESTVSHICEDLLRSRKNFKAPDCVVLETYIIGIHCMSENVITSPKNVSRPQIVLAYAVRWKSVEHYQAKNISDLNMTLLQILYYFYTSALYQVLSTSLARWFSASGLN